MKFDEDNKLHTSYKLLTGNKLTMNFRLLKPKCSFGKISLEKSNLPVNCVYPIVLSPRFVLCHINVLIGSHAQSFKSSESI